MSINVSAEEETKFILSTKLNTERFSKTKLTELQVVLDKIFKLLITSEGIQFVKNLEVEDDRYNMVYFVNSLNDIKTRISILNYLIQINNEGS